MRNGSAWIAAPARWAALLAVITAAVALRLNADLWRDLWEDEVIAAAHAEHPFWRMPVTVFRLDVHPPLYFMQLHLWRLFGDGDLWLRLNSVVWNLLAVGSVFLVVRRLYGRFEAYAAASRSRRLPCGWPRRYGHTHGYTAFLSGPSASSSSASARYPNQAG